jgi:hypothetical protein
MPQSFKGIVHVIFDMQAAKEEAEVARRVTEGEADGMRQTKDSRSRTYIYPQTQW